MRKNNYKIKKNEKGLYLQVSYEKLIQEYRKKPTRLLCKSNAGVGRTQKCEPNLFWNMYVRLDRNWTKFQYTNISKEPIYQNI